MDTPLADGKGIWLESVSAVHLLALVQKQAPEIAARIPAEGLHEQLAELADVIDEHVRSHDLGLPFRIMSLLDRLLEEKPASELENAIQISFVQPAELNASELGRELLAKTPARIRRLLASV